MKILPDQYEIQARIVPALLCSLPFIAFGFYLLNQVDAGFWGSVLALGVGGVSMTYSLYQLAIQSCRLMGKYLEQQIFKNSQNFPTTTLLLDEDTNYSKDHKRRIVSKIKTSLKISLSGRTSDSVENRLVINEAVSLIRKQIFGKSLMVSQANIQFGFIRNLTGGAILAAASSALGLIGGVVFSATVATYTFTILLSTYLAILIVGPWAIRFTAKHYAHALFDEFLAQ